MNNTLALYAWNARSPSDSPQVAHAFAIRGADPKIAATIAVAKAVVFFIVTFTSSAALH
jgi:hypothetical protein